MNKRKQEVPEDWATKQDAWVASDGSFHIQERDAIAHSAKKEAQRDLNHLILSSDLPSRQADLVREFVNEKGEELYEILARAHGFGGLR